MFKTKSDAYYLLELWLAQAEQLSNLHKPVRQSFKLVLTLCLHVGKQRKVGDTVSV